MLDWITAFVFLGFVGALGLYIVLKALRFRLRDPPDNYARLVAIANVEDAPLPAKIRTPVVRRLLIQGSRTPSALTNLRQMSASALAVDVPVKKPLIYGFFHPNAAAFGGGERVLWAAIKALVESDERAVAAIYVAAQPGLDPEQVLATVASRFGIAYTKKQGDRIVFIVLSQAALIAPTTFPLLTLLGQAIGQAVLGYEAIANLMPDVFVDTSGLAFSFPVVSWFAKVPVVAYVHYPFVQEAMVRGLHARLTRPRSVLKYVYYKALTRAYRWAGAYADVVSVNGSWTEKYLDWPQPKRVIFPPCAVQDFAAPEGDSKRSAAFVYLAQFRPEKRHALAIAEFAKARKRALKSSVPKPHLILIGSVRNDDDKEYVRNLHLVAKACELGENDYAIVENAPWDSVKTILSASSFGLNAMWNEHFGMGVVEIMAAGLIPIVNATGGPFMDIVRDAEGAPGFFFRSEHDPDYAPGSGFPTLSEAMLEALRLPADAQAALRARCFAAAQRFSDGAFEEAWRGELERVAPRVAECVAERKKLKLFD